MKCRFCGVEVEEGVKTCPACGKKISKDKFPVWAVVLIVLASLFILIAPILIVAAMTIPALMMNTDRAKFRTHFRKIDSTISQAYLLSEAINGEQYTTTDLVWNKTIKAQLANLTDIEGGVRLYDGAEIKYTKLNEKCYKSSEVSEIGAYTACAELTIDVNGFDKAPNIVTTGPRAKNVGDRFTLWMYSDRATYAPGSAEYRIMTGE